MSSPLRARKSALIGLAAACATIGATSPVWAGTTSQHGPTPERAGHQNTASANAIVVAALQAEIAQLKAALKSDHAALVNAKHANHAELRSAKQAEAAAARWKHKSEQTKTRIVTVNSTKHFDDPTKRSDDPSNGKPCDHHGVDPSNWRGGHDHHHHGDWSGKSWH